MYKNAKKVSIIVSYFQTKEKPLKSFKSQAMHAGKSTNILIWMDSVFDFINFISFF